MANQAWNPTTWVPYLPWIGVAYIINDAQSSLFKGPYKLLIMAAYLAIYTIASFWQGQDEVFHIPQAQAYCVGDFHIWDPKLTTPPGLYAFATIFGNLGGIRTCDVFTLRLFNTLVLIFTMSYASSCHGLINRLSNASPSRMSPDTIHTAFNIAIFPLIFFFSGLFYTDVLSTCLVLRMYKSFLKRNPGVWLYMVGILALTMRQTNIFWVAIYMGGLEVVRTLMDIQPPPLEDLPQPKTWREVVISTFNRYARGEIHDISLKDAELYDFILCPISIAIAVLYHPILVISKTWPFISLLVSFGAFVCWNGGVVLGDKANHVATVHLAQLLYLWPFIAFFSLPLLLTSALSKVFSLISPITAFLSSRQSTHPASTSFSSPIQRKLRLIFNLTFLFTSLIIILLIIKYNTLIHPFTLADNRHYVFYVFRYTILRHPLIRYLLAPAYMLSFYLTYLALSNPSSPTPLQTKRLNTRPQEQADGPRTSFLLVFVLSTALSLITAPLVEPRYFIIPWVVWRLHVPTSPPRISSRPSRKKTTRTKSEEGILARFSEVVRFWATEGGGGRLWGETFWFLLINAVTGYVFLYRGFEWPQEPGNVQRFMW